MLDISDEDLKIVKEILQKYLPDCEVRAFGSRVKKTARKNSDLDLAVVGKEKLSLSLRTQLQEAFEESVLPFRVDVVDWNSISDEFRRIIEGQYEVIQL